MKQRITWDEAKQSYPDEWVAFVEYDETDGFPSAGTVIVHHPERQQFHQLVKNFVPHYHDMALLYTGQRVKYPEIPLLWQITDIDSTNT